MLAEDVGSFPNVGPEEPSPTPAGLIPCAVADFLLMPIILMCNWLLTGIVQGTNCANLRLEALALKLWESRLREPAVGAMQVHMTHF